MIKLKDLLTEVNLSDEMEELKQYIDNDASLYRQRYMPILKNLSKKKKKGQYRKGLAQRAFMYLVDDGAKRYVRSYGGNVRDVFPKRQRKQLAKDYVEEFDQIFMDSINETIPKKNNFYIEALYDFFGNRDPNNQKVNILKSAELLNKENEISFKTIQNKIQPIVDIKVKRDSYFKFKSGIFPIDIEREGFDFMSIDSTDNTQLEKIKNKKIKERNDFNLNHRNYIKNVSNSYLDHENKESKFEVFRKSRKFNFRLLELSYIGYEPVYVIEYFPKSSRGKYKGRLFIHADDFALIRIDYQSIGFLRNFNFLGVFYRLDKRLVKRIFKKNENNKYELYFAENYYESSFGLDRPLKIIEKNKNVRGRRKQNQLSMQLNFAGNNKVKTEVIFIETNMINIDDYNRFKEIDSELPVELKKYDPNFWAGYNILEPKQILKEFKVENEN